MSRPQGLPKFEGALLTFIEAKPAELSLKDAAMAFAAAKGARELADDAQPFSGELSASAELLLSVAVSAVLDVRGDW